MLLAITGACATNTRLARFQKVLLAAGRTAHYQPWLRAAGLDAREDVARLRSPEEGLRRLPVLELETFLAFPERFHNAGAERAARLPRWQGWRLESAVGTVEELLRMERPPRGARRMVVRTTLGELPLGDADRDRLWCAFGLPVYHQIRGFDGELLAWECEAHCGLHLNAEAAVAETRGSELVLTSLDGLRYPLLRIASGFRAEPGETPCACGEAGWRLSQRKAVGRALTLSAGVRAGAPDQAQRREARG
jgi:hypothetical protein